MRSRSLLLTLLTLFFVACATPLGPGFWIEKQSYDLRYAASSPAHMEVRAAYTLRNAGNAPLAVLSVRLPDVQSTGRRNVRVLIDGREVAARAASDLLAQTIEIPFDPPWPQAERRELVLEYELAPDSPGHAGVSVNEHSGHLRRSGWFPKLLRPEALLAKGGPRAEKVPIAIHVPEDFRALSSGHERGARRRNGETEFRFELRKDDFDPFLVAGRYIETRITAGASDVIFWTLRPLDHSEATQAAARIAASFHIYETYFGRVTRKGRRVWVVESEARLSPRTDADAPAGVSFPDGALLNRAAFALGVSSDAFLALVEHELAHIWFGETLVARSEYELLLSESLAEYATLVAAEARDPDARRHRTALLLRWYDEARARAAEEPIEALRSSSPWEQRVFAYNKGALFFVALEDEFGKEAVRRALARMVAALHGQRAGLHDLRAALEGETGKPLGAFIRAWLFQTGITADFRARYEVTPTQKD